MNASQVSDIRALEANTSYNAANKAAFHKVARKVLRRLAKALNVSAPIYSNQGGIAVSGEITLHADHLHAWIEQWRDPILIYRACQSTKDYTGSADHIIDATDLVTRFDDVVRGIREVVEREYLAIEDELATD